MSPRDRRLLRDMIENADIAMMNSGGVSPAAFDETPPLKYTTLYAILIVGEAASKVSENVKLAHPQVPWSEIVGTRHFVAHGYDRVDPKTIMEIGQNDMPILIDALRRILDLEPPS